MPLKVIGVGFGRTGTNSLKHALEMLGFAKCHHMVEVIENLEQAPLFLAAARGEVVDWDTIYEGYQSCCDWPSCHFWRELSAYYPEAKVILSHRNAQSWFNSMSETILPLLTNKPSKDADPIMQMGHEIVFEQTFGGRVDDRDHVIGVYERHNQAVRESIAPDRLLVFEAKDGWEPLCAFLEVPVPEQPYPNTNAPDEFRQIVQRLDERLDT
jgi:Sulfotransferase domain